MRRAMETGVDPPDEEERAPRGLEGLLQAATDSNHDLPISPRALGCSPIDYENQLVA